MRAAVTTRYGPPEVLQIREVDKSVPKDNEVLIKVHATSVTVADTRMRGFRVPPSFWIPASQHPERAEGADLRRLRERRHLPVQLAKHYGAEVTGVCSTANLELVRSLGADRVIDYTREDLARDGAIYDVAFDAVGKARLRDCMRSLKKGGAYLQAVATPRMSARMRWAGLINGKRRSAGTPTKERTVWTFSASL